mgnify:CR=1 FL=1
MMKITCDECGREFPEYSMFVRVEMENSPTTFADPYKERHFCCWGCVVKYGKKQTGEVDGNQH